MPYLSPESLPSDVCTITLEIPNDELLRLAVMGQVYELTHSYLWEQYGAITPAQVAAAMLTTYNSAQYCDSPCPPFVGAKNMIVANASANQNLSATPVVVTWDEQIDTGGQFASNRLTATELSYWAIYAQAQINLAGGVVFEVRKNGSTIIASSTMTFTVVGTITVTVMAGALLNPTDYLEIYATSSSNTQLQKTSGKAMLVALQIAV